MTERRPSLTVEIALYLAALIVALGLRFYNLNQPPLAEAEARQALSAYQLVNGGQPAAAASPAYVFAAYFAFLLFGASEATARLGPALAGAAVVCLPWFFRDVLGRWAALMLAGLLALSATLLAGSRAVDGNLLALAALGYGLAAWRLHLKDGSRPALLAAGLGLGIGLAAGGPALTGLLAGLLATLLLAWWAPDARPGLAAGWERARAESRTLLLAAGCAALAVALVGGLYRPGLGGLAAAWSNWFAGFRGGADGLPPLSVLLALAAYEPLAIGYGLFGLSEAVSRRDRVGQWLGLYLLAALALLLARGGREPLAAVWVVWPAAALAARAAVDLAGSLPDGQRPALAAQWAVLTALLSFANLNFAALAEQLRANPDLTQGTVMLMGLTIPLSRVAYIYLVLMGFSLVGVVTYLFRLGWSAPLAWRGLALSIFAALLASGLTSAWSLTQLRPASGAELWRPQPAAADLRRLQQTLSDTSNYSTGGDYDLKLLVQAPPDGLLAWTLRRFPHAQFVSALDASVDSPAVIAPAAVDNPTLGSAYVGQRFTQSLTRIGGLDDWAGWANWIAFRRVPVQPDYIILWVRQDVHQLKDARATP